MLKLGSRLSVVVLSLLMLTGQNAHSKTPQRSEFDWILESLSPSETCRPPTERVLALLDRYRTFGGMNRGHKAAKVARTIQDTLNKAEADGDPCFHTIASAYAIGSIRALGSLSELGASKIIAALAKIGKLKPLSKSSRLELWGTQGQEILGGYDCSTASVYFDPYLSPLNLGGTLLHELDHLARDKFYSEPADLSSIDSVLLDESSASMVAAYYQIRQTAAIHLVSRFGLGQMRNLEPFSFQSDNNLYAKNGFLKHLWRLQHTDYPYDRKFQDFWGEMESMGRDTQPEIEAIFGHVSQIYLPNTPIHEEELFRRSGTLDRYFEFEDRALRFFPHGQSHREISLDEFKAIIDRPSNRCARFEAAIDSGELDDYIGHFGVGGVRPGSGGVRPGVGGVRPNTRIRPCLRLSSEF